MNDDEHEARYYENMQRERLSKSYKQIAGMEFRNALKIPDNEPLIIGEGWYFQAAVMILEICNFKNRLLNTETEQINNLKGLNLFFTEMMRIAEDYCGTVEKNKGEGLMVFFEEPGDNTSPDTACRRAVSCGLTMFRTAERLIDPMLTQIGIEPFGFKLGIDCGPVTIAMMGTPRCFNSIVPVGNTATVVYKMLSFGSAGEMLIGDGLKENLPEEWKKFTSPLKKESGIVYKETQRPYIFYKYTNRFTN